MYLPKGYQATEAQLERVARFLRLLLREWTDLGTGFGVEARPVMVDHQTGGQVYELAPEGVEGAERRAPWNAGDR